MVIEINEADRSVVRWSADGKTNWRSADIDDLIRAYEVNRWIPVTERLPEHNEDVLISCGHIVEAGWYNEIDGAWCAEGCSSLPVTAWMPLPECYRGEEND